MKGKHQFLSGLHNDQHRAVMGNLIDDGWTPARTGSGHIKLTHPLAHKPIFASSTPSDRNAGANLKRSAARAMRMSTVTSIVPAEDMTETIEEMVSKVAKFPPGQSPLPNKKKQRWTQEERIARDAAALLAKERLQVQADAKLALKAEKEDYKSARNAEKASRVEAVSDAKAPLIIAAEEFKIIETSAAPKQITPSQVLEIEQDLLDIAVKMVSGLYTSLDITEEMVGGYLLIEGDAFIADAASSGYVQEIVPAAAIKATPAPAPDLTERASIQGLMTTKESALDAGKPRAIILDALKGRGDAGGTCKEIAGLVHQDPSHAQSECVRHQLQKLIRDGFATTERRGRSVVFIANK